MLLPASIIVFLIPSLAPNHDSGAGVEYVAFARAIDLDSDRSGDSHSDSDSDGRTRQEGTQDVWKQQTSEGQQRGIIGNISKGKNNGFFENASTLEDVWSDLKLLVPNRGSDGYIPPEAMVVADFENIVLEMMMVGQRYNFPGDNEKDHEKNQHDNDDSRVHTSSSSSCDDIDLRSLKGMYRIGTFVDRENGRSYCIFATTSILYPWGNVVVDLDASPATKNLSFDCPHPKFDAETAEQGLRMLKGTTSRSWIVAGSHRMANNRAFGTCQPQLSYYPSDAAHSVDTCFLAAVAAIKFYYESIVQQDYTSVQLHGMGKTSCGTIDTFFSHGSCSQQTIVANADEKIDILQRIARAHPFDNGRHTVAGRDDDDDDSGSSSGSNDCNLCGSTNIQGRLINGVARIDLCDTLASSYTGRFIQIEQKREYRRESLARFWNDVFNEAYPLFSALATVSTNPQQTQAQHSSSSSSSSANEDVGIDDENDFYEMCIGVRNNLQTTMTDQRI